MRNLYRILCVALLLILVVIGVAFAPLAIALLIIAPGWSKSGPGIIIGVYVAAVVALFKEATRNPHEPKGSYHSCVECGAPVTDYRRKYCSHLCQKIAAEKRVARRLDGMGPTEEIPF